MTSLGTYTAYINGREVRYNEAMDDIFNPGCTDYTHFVNYQTYDVTDYIDGASLALGVLVGRGWYAGGAGRSMGTYRSVVGSPDALELCLLGKLILTYEDGSTDTILANTTDWKSTDNTPWCNDLATASAEYMSDDLYHGKKYDATKEAGTEGWNNVNFDDASWNAVTSLTYSGDVVSSNGAAYTYVDDSLEQHPQNGQNTYKYKPSEIMKSQDDGGTSQYPWGEVVSEPVDVNDAIVLHPDETLILDMQQNMVGVVNLTVTGEEGTVVQLRHAEMLNDGRTNPSVEAGGSDGPKGTIYQKHLKAGGGECEATDRYRLNHSDEQTYQPTLTYHGFRYVEITTDQTIAINEVVGKVITSAIDKTGYLETSNADVNQLISNANWSQIGNYLSIPTDCPQRAERAGWTGDAQLFSETGTFNFDSISFLENYVRMLNANEAVNESFGAIVPGMGGF